jgi:hypothetical protein
MNEREAAWLDQQRRRFMRPNAHLYWRPDAARFLPAHLHDLLPPQLRPAPHDGHDRARPNIAQWTGKRGRWMPDPILDASPAAAAAPSARVDALRRAREIDEARAGLLDLKWQIVALRYLLAARKYRRALDADRERAEGRLPPRPAALARRLGPHQRAMVGRRRHRRAGR